MRGFTLRAVPVCFVVLAAGCFTTKSEFKVTEPTPRSPTHTYWQGVNATLSRKAAGNDLKSILQLVRAQNDALRELSPEGVDETLVAAVDEVIRCEEDVLRIAEMCENDATKLRSSKEMVGAFGAANRKAADAKKQLRALRDTLNTRHGDGFAPLGG
jgi:hypothetical protein